MQYYFFNNEYSKNMNFIKVNENNYLKMSPAAPGSQTINRLFPSFKRPGFAT